MHTACDCSCKGSESGKAEAVTAEVGGFELNYLRNGGEAPTEFSFPTYHTSLLEKTSYQLEKVSYHTSLSTN